MTIDETFDRLRSLQDVLAEKIALERKLLEMPKVLEGLEEALAKKKAEYVKNDEAYVDYREQQADWRNKLLEAEGRREKAEKSMEATSTQREYEIIDKEIRDAAEKEQECRKELQHVEKRLHGLNEANTGTKALVDSMEAELAGARQEIEKGQAEEGAKLDGLVRTEKELSNGLGAELLFKFERIIRKKGSRGIVAVKGGVCESCHMILPVQFANVVRLKEEIVSCPYCSSFLYHKDVDEGQASFLDDDLGSLAGLDDEEEEPAEEDYEIEDEEPAGADFEE